MDTLPKDVINIIVELFIRDLFELDKVDEKNWSIELIEYMDSNRSMNRGKCRRLLDFAVCSRTILSIMCDNSIASAAFTALRIARSNPRLKLSDQHMKKYKRYEIIKCEKHILLGCHEPHRMLKGEATCDPGALRVTFTTTLPRIKDYTQKDKLKYHCLLQFDSNKSVCCCIGYYGPIKVCEMNEECPYYSQQTELAEITIKDISRCKLSFGYGINTSFYIYYVPATKYLFSCLPSIV